MKAIEIYSFAQATLLRLPPTMRREIGRRLSVIAAGNYQGLVSYGGGVYSFQVTGGVTIYIEDRQDRVVIFHVVR